MVPGEGPHRAPSIPFGLIAPALSPDFEKESSPADYRDDVDVSADKWKDTVPLGYRKPGHKIAIQ